MIYSAEDKARILGDVLTNLANGVSLMQQCSRGIIPCDHATIYRWMDAAGEDYARRYARARATCAEHIIAECDGYVEDVVKGVMTPEQARVALGYKQWLAGRIAPKVYGDKVHLAGDEDNPVRVDIARLTDAELMERATKLREETARLPVAEGGAIE